MYTQQQDAVLEGHGHHLGLPVRWRLQFNSIGAFDEVITSKHMTHRWGYPGVAVGHDAGGHPSASPLASASPHAPASPSPPHSWEMNYSGLARPLELDDHEASLLCAWVRTTWFLHPAAAPHIRLTLAPSPPHPSTNPHLHLTLPSGRVRATVEVCSTTWRPLQLLIPQFGHVERWVFRRWRPVLGEGMAPTVVEHHTWAGSVHWYATDEGLQDGRVAAALKFDAGGCCDAPQPPAPSSPYTMPPSPPSTPPTRLNPHTPAWYTSSGHLLVRPRIDGQEAGYMIVDTGASGLVLDPSALSALPTLERFGSFHVVGMGGMIAASYASAERLELGPLVVQGPMFMVMSVQGLVPSPPGPIVGILGYDVLCRATFDIPPMPSAAQPHQDTVIRIYPNDVADTIDNPYSIPPSSPLYADRYYDGPDLEFLQCVIISNLPYLAGVVPAGQHLHEGSGQHTHADIGQHPNTQPVEERVVVAADGSTGVGLFMLDSGAGGADAIVHQHVAHRLGLLAPEGEGHGARTLKGVGGGDANNMRVHTGRMPYVQLLDGPGTPQHTPWLGVDGTPTPTHTSSCSVRFEDVSCFFATNRGLDVSRYTAGILCGDLLARRRVVYDYERRRIGFS